jgi:hypothetical protein
LILPKSGSHKTQGKIKEMFHTEEVYKNAICRTRTNLFVHNARSLLETNGVPGEETRVKDKSPLNCSYNFSINFKTHFKCSHVFFTQYKALCCAPHQQKSNYLLAWISYMLKHYQHPQVLLCMGYKTDCTAALMFPLKYVIASIEGTLVTFVKIHMPFDSEILLLTIQPIKTKVLLHEDITC